MRHWSEDLANWYLQWQGLALVERNYHCRWGEIDLVMTDARTGETILVFVEVRYRIRSDHGRPEETISRSKQRRILSTAQHYLQKRQVQDVTMRFDVIAITQPHYAPSITWIQEAFT